MKITVKKLFKGLVSVRDYIIDQAFRWNEDLVIMYDGKKMTIPKTDLKKGWIQTNRKVFTAKYALPDGKSTYTIFDRKWQPDEVTA